MAYSAVRGTGMLEAGRTVVDMAERIVKLQPSANPLRVFSSKLGKRKLANTQFYWIEDEWDSVWITLVDAVAGGGTTEADIVVTTDEETLTKVGDILYSPDSGERLRVTEVDVTNHEINVAKVGAGNITAIAAAKKLLVVGNAFEQGSDAGAEYAGALTMPFNYTQIFKTDFGVTGTLDSVQLHGSQELARLRNKKAIEHNLDIERALIFGNRYTETGTTHPRTYMGGFLYYMEAAGVNAWTIDYSTATYALFEAYLAGLFANGVYSSDQKILFAGVDLITLINSWALPAYRVKTGEVKYGVPIMRITSAHGEIVVAKEPVLDEGLTKWGLVADPSYMKYCYLQKRDTKLRLNTQTAGSDKYTEEYLTECSFELQHPELHGIIKLADA